MRLEFSASEIDGAIGHGLEIDVSGFAGSPTDENGHRAQVYIEAYEGKLRINVWDGSSEDPQTIEIERR
jgi:hypothetical protein